MNINTTNTTALTKFLGCEFDDDESQREGYVQSTIDLVEFSFLLAVVVFIWNLLQPILTILSNLTVILTVFFNHQLRRVPSNVIVASLAFADLITGKICICNSRTAYGFFNLEIIGRDLLQLFPNYKTEKFRGLPKN